jgi:hypothetical protein
MNDSGMPPLQPTSCCARLQPLLALLRTDALSTQETAQLTTHLADCRWCQRELDAYDALDAAARRHFSDITFAPLALKDIVQASDDLADAPSFVAMSPRATLPDRLLPRQLQRRSPARRATFGAIAAVLFVGVVVAGFAALLSHRQYGRSATTDFNGDFGPTVLPTGPQPQVGHWRQTSLPNGVPDQSSASFSVTLQTSVPDLLYGCYQAEDNPLVPEPRRLWRSEDGGRSWAALTPPSGTEPQQAGCNVVVSPGAPDVVFLNGNAGGVSYYSLDRGEHWQMLQQPAGAESWHVAAPIVEGNVWYYIRTVGVSQPEIWVSRDHGAQWVRHMYPVPLPSATPVAPNGMVYPGIGPDLLLRYEKGGLLFLFENTLWWSPDYGTTWQKLETWSTPPCDRAIVGSPDLSVLYCVQWYEEQKQSQPYWRSLDHGQTWQAVPTGPIISAGGASHASSGWLMSPVVLQDGSLLQVSAIPSAADSAAFYSLAPRANVWTQASAPLNDFFAHCPPAGPETPVPVWCVAYAIPTLASGPTGMQYVYGIRLSDTRLVVGQITWGDGSLASQ